MTKAKTIDRLELTRQKFGGRSKSDHIGDVTDMIKQPDDGLKECPVCKSKSLRLDGGCMSCLSCGWSACG